MVWYVHVNRHVIDRNRRHGTTEPPIAIRRGKRGAVTYAHGVKLPAGSRMVYDAHKPLLSCGARLVIVCNEEPEALP